MKTKNKVKVTAAIMVGLGVCSQNLLADQEYDGKSARASYMSDDRFRDTDITSSHRNEWKYWNDVDWDDEAGNQPYWCGKNRFRLSCWDDGKDDDRDNINKKKLPLGNKNDGSVKFSKTRLDLIRFV